MRAACIGTPRRRASEDPGFAFSITAYTKGSLFLRTLEDLLGRTTLDRFLRDYFRSFSFRWVDDRTFLSRLTATLGRTPEASLRLNEWIYGTGLPSNITAPTSSALATRVMNRVNAFNAGANISTLDPQSWTDFETDLFLGQVGAPAIAPRMEEIDAALGLSLRTTPPANWLRNAISTRYAPADAAVERFLMRGGPNGTIVLLYAGLIDVNRGRAQQIFNAARERYHPGVVEAIEKLFENEQALTDAA